MSIVRDNPEKRRYEILEDDGVAGFVDYRRSPGQIRFVHTETDPAHAGKGLAKQLVTAALEDARNEGLSVLPECPYVRKVITDDRDRFLDLVLPADRPTFGLD